MLPVRFGPVVAEVEAIIFDKDGTLVDCFPWWMAMAEERRKALGEIIRLTPDLAAHLDAVDGYDRGRCWIDPAGPLAMASRAEETIIAAGALYRYAGLGWSEARSVIEKAFARAEERLLARIGEVSQALPGAAAALSDLRKAGLRLAVATTDMVTRSEVMLTMTGLRPFLHYLGGSDLVKRGKPHPDLVLHVCEQLGVQPEHVAMVGDTPDDMALGRNAGVRLKVGVLTGTNPREKLEPLADVVIGSVAEIRPAG
ncbi:MAG TPA: HAD family hydrolase [Bacillota bacterium]|jgi:phosphoglycolate phosphatase